MQAIVKTRSGPPEVLQLQEVEKPVPKADEVLVRVVATTVTVGDVMLRKLSPLLALPMQWFFGVPRKKIPGHEFAGVVEAAGDSGGPFQPGERVFGTTSGLPVGAYAEYVCVPAAGTLARIPDNVPFEQAAALPVGGMTALYLLRQGGLQAGQEALVYGASGSVGTYGVQIARQAGARVTGVCSTRNVELVRSLGAEAVIDYTQEDVAAGGPRYDLVFDAVGKLPDEQAKKVLKPGGSSVSVRSTTHEKSGNLQFLAELLAAGEVRAVIDRRYPLAQAAEAHRYVEQGRKAGNVVLNVAGEGDH